MATRPTFKKLDHAALTVADIEAVVDFYTQVLGAKIRYRMGPFDARELPAMEDGKDWTEAHIGVVDASLLIAVLEIAPNFCLELFQYSRPKSLLQSPPEKYQVGGNHLCFEVDDVETAIDYLSLHNCSAESKPIIMEDGPGKPSKSWYVKDPFGHQLELVEYL